MWVFLLLAIFLEVNVFSMPVSFTSCPLLFNNISGACLIPQPPTQGSIYLLGPLGGQESLISNCLDTKVTAGAQARFACRRKYQLQGSEILKCQSNGQWDKHIPTCNKMCAPIYSPTIIQECETEGRAVPCDKELKQGSTINLKCKSRHSTRENLPKLTCINGSWSHNISKCEPECGVLSSKNTPLVVGGKPARHSGLPWMVGIYSLLMDFKTSQHICGGTIISNTIVISVAHCFWNEETGELHNADKYQVVTGKIYRDYYNEEDSKYTATVQKVNVTKIQIPVTYGGELQNQQSDIAILKLKEVLEFSQFVMPACINFDPAFERNQSEAGNIGKAGGWGSIPEGEGPSEVLKIVDLPTVQYAQCRSSVPKSFIKYMTADKMCAGYLNGTNLCYGDAGGGLLIKNKKHRKERWYLHAIASIGVSSDQIGKCRNDSYVWFTSVFFHGDWIRQTIANIGA